jgi:CheY-like chemotaxis protein
MSARRDSKPGVKHSGIWEASEPRGPATVLLVDDDARFRTTVRLALLDHGYETREVDNGAEALELLAAAADDAGPMPDVIVLDVLMPGLSGLGILQVMRRLGTRMPPTLLVTGFRDPSLDILARKLGAARVLRKPIAAEDVSAAVLEEVMRDARARGKGSARS